MRRNQHHFHLVGTLDSLHESEAAVFWFDNASPENSCFVVDLVNTWCSQLCLYSAKKITHFIWRMISTCPSQKATQTFFLDASLYVRSENVNLILNCKWLPGVGCPVHGKTQKNPHSWKNTKMATKGMSRPVVPLLRHVINVSIWALVFALVQSP